MIRVPGGIAVFWLPCTQCSLQMRGLWSLPIGSNVDLSGGLSSALLVISSADSAKARHDVSEPHRDRMALSVFGNLMVEGVIDGDSTTAMVFGVCGGPIA